MIASMAIKQISALDTQGIISMMGERNIEDSDSEDSDFKIPAEDLSNESSISESDSTISEIEGISNSSVEKKKKIKKTKNKMKSSLNINVLAPDYVKHTSTDYVEGNPEKEKERTDLLWNNFLSSTGKQSKPCERNSQELTENSQMLGEPISKVDISLEMNEKVISSITKTSKFKQTQTNVFTSSRKCQIFTQHPNDLKRRGLSNILSTISKKSKLNTLEKSKQDWNQFKEEHDLNEEITNFNRGKNGYLERQDFLQRTDSRQFEIEKELRNSGRRKTK